MKNSMNALNVSLTFCFISTFLFGQESNKYTRKNTSAPVINYSTEKCYARTIIVENNTVFTGNSDGTLWKTDLSTKQSTNLLENRNFGEMRDLAFVNASFIGMQSGTNGLLVKTTPIDFKNFVSPTSGIWHGVFLDGMDFYSTTGFLMGDPKNGKFSLFVSTDNGDTWESCKGSIDAIEGEAAFAASGKNVQLLNDSTFMFVSGGMKSRFFKSTNKGLSWEYSSLPFFASESNGAFSVCFQNNQMGVVVGGDYANPQLNKNCSYYTNDGGKFWTNSSIQPRGFRSCVIEKNGIYYCCGTSGIDVSFDNGKTWKAFANGNYFSMTTDQKHLYATTVNGSFQVFTLINEE
jgi:photosystem II stability/assembly factor-like uncharacterized protein